MIFFGIAAATRCLHENSGLCKKRDRLYVTDKVAPVYAKIVIYFPSFIHFLVNDDESQNPEISIDVEILKSEFFLYSN